MFWNVTGTEQQPSRLVWIKIQVDEVIAQQLRDLAKSNERTAPAELRVALAEHLKRAA